MGDALPPRIGPEPVRLPVALAMSLVFDEHDVLANRRGQLSDWQRQRFDRADGGRRGVASRLRRRRPPPSLPAVVTSVGVPLVSPSAIPGCWRVRIGAVSLDLDGATVATLDPVNTLRAYAAAVASGGHVLLSAELVD